MRLLPLSSSLSVQPFEVSCLPAQKTSQIDPITGIFSTTMRKKIVQNPPMRQSVGNSAAAFESGIPFRRLGGEPASPGDQRFGFRLL